MSEERLSCNTLQHTATHCNTLQHTATHCNTLQHATDAHILTQPGTHYPQRMCPRSVVFAELLECNSLQHTATHYNMQLIPYHNLTHPTHTGCDAEECPPTQDVTLKCLVYAELLGFNTLQHSATLCNTLDMRLICTLSTTQYPTHTGRDVKVRVIYRAVWVQHTTTRCNTLQHATDSCIAHFSTQLTHVGRDVKVCGV